MDKEKVINGLQIERECVSRDCDRNCGKCDLVQDRDWLLSVYDDAIELLKEQKVKEGKWIPITNGRGGMECSICHDYAPSYQSGAEYLSKYCPNCGAKMKGR